VNATLVLRGQMVRGFIVTCLACGVNDVCYRLGRPMTRAEAERWARKNGWTKSKDGWAHRACRRQAARPTQRRQKHVDQG
jgi:hypothetical protein